jgi:hypothetical protein
VELDCVGRRAAEDALGLEQHAQSLENSHRPTAVVVGTWCSEDRRQEQVDRVLMSANYNCLVARAWDGRNDGRLTPWMRERLDGRIDSTRVCKCLVHLAEQPG